MGRKKPKDEAVIETPPITEKMKLLAEAEANMKAYYYLCMSPARSDDELLAKAAIALGEKLYNEALEIKKRASNL